MENIGQHVAPFLSNLTGFTDQRVGAYRNALNLFVQSKIDIDEYSLANFDAYLRTAKYVRAGIKRPYSKATRQINVYALHQFMRWLDLEGLILHETLAKAENRLAMSQSRSRRTGVTFRTPDPRLHEIIDYYDHVPEPKNDQLRLELLRNRALLHCLWDTGARISEVLSITRAQIADGQNAQVSIIGKGEKERPLFFTPVSLARVKAYCAARDDRAPGLFISHRRGKGGRISKVAAWNIVHRAAVGTGVTGVVSPHMIRHARATQLVNEGMPIESVQVFLGHENISTTQTYYAKMRTDRVREQLEEYGLQPNEVS